MAEAKEVMQRITAAMKSYIDLGLPIIPLCSHDHRGYSEKHISRCNCAGKIPLTKGWQTHDKTTIGQAQSWLREFKNINIGLPMGHISGYVGIDVDGFGGEEMLIDMSAGEIPETWEYSTGDGRRLIYQIPVGLQTKKFVNQNKSETHTECSILAFGQQTVLPPSIHYSGKVYEWEEGKSPDDIDCAPAPSWLIELVRDDDERNRMKPGAVQKSGELTLDLSIPEDKEVVNPILVTKDSLPTEFINYQDIPFKDKVPAGGVKGKAAKTQQEKKAGLSPEELTEVLSEGGRDTGMTRIIGHFCAVHRSFGKDYIMHLAKQHNQTFCHPPLDDTSIEAKVNHFWETEEIKSAKYKSQSRADEAPQFESMRIAQAVLNLLEDEGKVLKASLREPVIWMTGRDEGPWEPKHVGGYAEDFQIHMLKALSDEDYGGAQKWVTRKNFGEVANSLLLLLRQAGRIWPIDTSDVNTQSMEGHDYIPLKGGKLLNWRTKELLPWDPETHLTYTLPIEYDPNAKSPNWEKRLAQWLPDEDVRKVIQEFVGYSFIPYMGFERALLIQGEGANGKSMFLETLQKMLGKDVTTSATMGFLFSRFGKKPLLGKILNIVNEAGADYLKGANADDFKNMVSGGAVMADIKNKDPMVFNNTAKFIFSANHDIKTSDKSAAWVRRMILIPFDQDFRNSKETKTEIMDELASEHAGIFNWALDGLRRLMDNKGFTDAKVLSDRMDEYIRKNDIAADFAAHCLHVRHEMTLEGKVVEQGVATSAVTDLFKLWTMYRGSELKKHGERIKEHMEKKMKLQTARKPNKFLTMTDATKTSCWLHTSIHVTDPEFLEYLQESGEILGINNSHLKVYLTKRLEELNEEPLHPKPPTPMNLAEVAATAD